MYHMFLVNIEINIPNLTIINSTVSEDARIEPRTSVADPDPNPDPDPRVFRSPGSGSGSTSQRYGSGSGSFYHHAKIVRKT
jgi:hypothetical protein